VAAASTTGFSLTLTIARFAGDPLVERFGVVRTVRAGGVVAALGGLLVVLSPNAAVAITGFGMLGLGIAVVVPLAFAAAGHKGPNASRAIAGVATVTYTSGLVAPSLIGAIAQATSLTMSFIVVTVLAFGITLSATVLRTDKEKVERI
jgi:MFS family permease